MIDYKGHKGEKKPPVRTLFAIRILAVIATALVLIILGGTAYAFFIRPPAPGAEADAPGSSAPERPPALSSGAAPGSTGGMAMFTGIGRRRIALNSGESATALLSITFPYPAADRDFTEELVGKIPVFRSITAAYFAALSADELRNLDEAAAKAEILRRFNAELLLGKIEVLYFNDLMILE